MRVVLQRVNFASVTVNGEIVGEIKKGILVLLGIDVSDTEKDAALIIRKTLGAKLWPGKEWATNVMQNNYELLITSQFTLCASLKKGSKPDFHASMKNTQSFGFFEEIVEMFRLEYNAEKIQTGSFGADMDVRLSNDGPVTIMMDSKDWNIDDVKVLACTQTAKTNVSLKLQNDLNNFDISPSKENENPDN